MFEEEWDLTKYFDDIVTKDYEDFCDDPDNIRYSLHLCSSLNHLLDWFYFHKKTELKNKGIDSVI